MPMPATSTGDALRALLAGYELVREVRGVGLLNGIEFEPPRSQRLRIPFLAFADAHPAMFGQMVARRLFREHGVLSRICGNNFMVLKVAPPLVVNDAQIEHCVRAIGQVVEAMHGSKAFWPEALGIGWSALAAA